MSNIVSKFKELYVRTVTLPDSGEIKIGQINVDFQDKLLRKIKKLKNEAASVLTYILHLDTYIYNSTKKDLTYKDKLYLLQHWRNIVKVKDTTNYDVNTSILEDTPYNTKVNTAKVEIGFKLPTLTFEIDLLKYLVKAEDPAETDLIFYDNFRFIKCLKIDDTTHNASDLSYEDLRELFLLFDLLFGKGN